MKVELFDFQKDALETLRRKLLTARSSADIENPQAISFSAPTGAGKTIVMTALFENILFGEDGFKAQPDAVILWISDMPELNEQTRLKIEGKSDRIRVRQLVNIDAAFDAEQLEGGHIYFVNTQKLGTEKLLTRKGDNRQYTIWETFTKTAISVPDRFYVVIDEAHRGMRRSQDIQKAQTIMQRFLLGSEEDGLCLMPLVIGISATPRRFLDLLATAPHTIHKVDVPADEVRTSGLLKDRILIHYPDSTNGAEMTLLAEAAKLWKQMEAYWDNYCKRESESVVWPILVLQVEDGTEQMPTRTDLATALNTIELTIGRILLEGEITHTFNDVGELIIGNRKVRRIEASRIEEDRHVGVVIFKMNLSTGWDCPRAEVMMSFRRAEDHTYIAQLLGRMVRTPLARRIESNAALNDVHLFLPHYNRKAVDEVISDLKNVEDVPPSETGTSRELVTLHRRPGIEKIFSSMATLITYRVNAVRKQSGLRRLMGLGRRLAHDEIDEGAQNEVKGLIIAKMNREIKRLRDSGILEERSKNITGVALKTISVQHVTGISEEMAEYDVEAVSADIDRRFQQAGRLLGNGLHMEYWKTHADRDADAVKVEAIVLSEDHDSMRSLEEVAEVAFNEIYESHKRELSRLPERKRTQYDALRLAASIPQAIEWRLPDVIDFKRHPKSPIFEQHLYVEDDGKFRVELGTWETEVLNEELQDESVVGWLRNLDRKSWSLEIPYRTAGTVRPMFPDILVIRRDKKGFLFDILEPHDPSRDDNYFKAVGMAEFAEKHWNLFGRIQLIRKKRGSDGKERFYRLDVSKDAIRKQVLAVTSNQQLNQLFDQLAD